MGVTENNSGIRWKKGHMSKKNQGYNTGEERGGSRHSFAK